mmetsp:Transcript_10976/g.23694  ORF Transcript_10976/g.23694 Transcript_10976/m.23694 type:complete len:525 (-) Transcript_10976:28-1602(-)|eukprot:CAMPEP_0202892408 /NCGR_PEP_ID=MMETSP1392-20130828/2113_1 /ASSEMBLY_ACC=CAM_ASM_000868 /TAXON_ID=225041 /ORGANISM="Chlamydomonas chlamydogama, Strain SAG 11-48b" /LENGTH=524 /DNA_ID=CAMNT_0049576343 /DNA_START=255 /DNA_END=1829 /DNA_ORIENTATION=-
MNANRVYAQMKMAEGLGLHEKDRAKLVLPSIQKPAAASSPLADWEDMLKEQEQETKPHKHKHKHKARSKSVTKSDQALHLLRDLQKDGGISPDPTAAAPSEAPMRPRRSVGAPAPDNSSEMERISKELDRIKKGRVMQAAASKGMSTLPDPSFDRAGAHALESHAEAGQQRHSVPQVPAPYTEVGTQGALASRSLSGPLAPYPPAPCPGSSPPGPGALSPRPHRSPRVSSSSPTGPHPPAALQIPDDVPPDQLSAPLSDGAAAGRIGVSPRGGQNKSPRREHGRRGSMILGYYSSGGEGLDYKSLDCIPQDVSEQFRRHNRSSYTGSLPPGLDYPPSPPPAVLKPHHTMLAVNVDAIANNRPRRQVNEQLSPKQPVRLPALGHQAASPRQEQHYALPAHSNTYIPHVDELPTREGDFSFDNLPNGVGHGTPHADGIALSAPSHPKRHSMPSGELFARSPSPPLGAGRGPLSTSPSKIRQLNESSSSIGAAGQPGWDVQSRQGGLTSDPGRGPIASAMTFKRWQM